MAVPYSEKVDSPLRNLSEETHQECTVTIPKGCLPVYVSEERKRYVVPVQCLSSVMMRALLNQFKNDVDHAQHAITLPCSVELFEAVLKLSVDEKHPCNDMDSQDIEGTKDSFLKACIIICRKELLKKDVMDSIKSTERRKT